MKKIYTFLFTLFSVPTTFAQIQFEHTYSSCYLWRTRLDVSGETYVNMPGESHWFSIISNYPDRLFVRGYNSPQQWQTIVLDPASLQVLHTFSGSSVDRQVLPDGEEIYLQNINGEKVLIFNNQFQLIKTISLPNPSYSTIRISGSAILKDRPARRYA